MYVCMYVYTGMMSGEDDCAAVNLFTVKEGWWMETKLQFKIEMISE